MVPTEKRLHAIISGRVQGVGFRYFVQENAYRLNLKGWVRNRRDGTVEVEVQGSPQILDQFIQVLHKGPRSAIVSEVKTDWLPDSRELMDFRVRTTSD
jgi:acylphosphatase